MPHYTLNVQNVPAGQLYYCSSSSPLKYTMQIVHSKRNIIIMNVTRIGIQMFMGKSCSNTPWHRHAIVHRKVLQYYTIVILQFVLIFIKPMNVVHFLESLT